MSLLTAVVEGRHWLSNVPGLGSPSDCAEVVRLLLDAGAALPNPYQCKALAQLLGDVGAPELAARCVPPVRTV